MNPVKRIYPTTVTLVLILACVAGAQVASSVDAAISPPPASSNARVSSTASSPEAALNRLRGALTVGSFGSANESSGVFVVPAEAITVEDLAGINEDINVMTRIFEKKLRQANLLPQTSPYPLLGSIGYRAWGERGGSTRSMYLQGYGILFMMEVDFPLAPGSETQDTEQSAKPESDVDPVWAGARAEIYDPQRLDRQDNPYDSTPQYSEERVENLKAAVIEAFVHAANIRCLRPDESVIVTITGTPAARLSHAETIAIPGTGQVVVRGKNNELKIVEGLVSNDAPTVLTIRAKASDIKALAAGQLGEPQFQQRVQVLSHPAIGASAGSSVTTRTVVTPSRGLRTGGR
jgi:hypothetical protein